MKKLKIINIQDFLYTFCDKENKKYDLIIEFNGDKKPQVNDEIVIANSLIDVKSPDFVQPYSFRLCEKRYDEVKDNNDYILVKQKNLILVYERRYG